jgi:16S rRNA (guanine(966)-N(2))-methyltransferase RsmD
MVKSNIQIIAGKHRGKKLYMAGENTRSTKNILKESVFNSLQFEVPDSIWVEVFAGTGSIGLEALSRDAKFAYFLEKDPNSFKVLNKNIEECKESENCEAILGDSFETIWDVVEKLQRDREKAYFYFDPPFAIREGNEKIYDEVIKTISQLPKLNVEKIIIEHQTGVDFPETIAKYKKTKTRKFGKSSVTYYE